MFTLDDSSFRKEEPEAITLIEIMAGLYKDERSAVRLVARYGIRDTEIERGLKPIDLWDFLLEELAKRGKLRASVKAARDQFSENTNVPFLDELLSRGRYDIPGDAEAEDFHPWEYLGLFDRTTESGLLGEMLFPFAVPPPLPPIVIGILAERADEYDYFVRHVSAGILGRLLGSTGASQDSDLLDWVADRRVTAEFEIRKIAAKKIGNERDKIDNIIPRLGPALAGRTTTLGLSTKDLAQAGVPAKLADFLGLWGRFGAHAPPPVLYVIVVRYDDADPSPEQTEPLLTSVFNQANGLTVLTPVTLSLCELKHFDGWRSALTELGRKFHPVKYDQFRKLFKATFRLGELKERLLLPEGRIYI